MNSTKYFSITKGTYAPINSLAAKSHLTSTASLPQKFYQNNVLDKYINQDAKKVTLRQLVMFGRNLTKSKLIASANYVLSELPVRLAHRIRDFQHLPYICGTNPYMGRVYQMYWKSFDEFRKFPKVTTLEENIKCCEMFTRNMKEHSQIIPLLGMGVSECVGLVDPELIDKFMNRMLMTRISRRTLVEQHTLLSKNFCPNEDETNCPEPPTNIPGLRAQIVGKVDTQCNIGNLVHECAAKAQSIFEDYYELVPGTAPQVIVDGHKDAQLMCVTDHIEYIVFELLKNSMKASIQNAIDNSGINGFDQNDLDFLPINVTICQTKANVTVRISDKGGGIPPDVYKQIWNYCSPYKSKFLTNFHRIKEMQAKTNENTGISPLVPLGFGLPMCSVFANYWGGDINIYSLPGYGVDSYIRLPRLGNIAENPAIEDTEVLDEVAIHHHK
ncbi:hypothetical protein BB559_004133 [Furculomyces boomerangus]|uniref:Protein-serine/threonine kinase n=1 Tax=Furculomyces boomerangus TaxID=61424 RepID=A0A2T9YGK6_9FUNG|nr:hypothetical protein BB559_004133 [Furculomyces boomerangus]